jgi:hypothetical protein
MEHRSNEKTGYIDARPMTYQVDKSTQNPLQRPAGPYIGSETLQTASAATNTSGPPVSGMMNP